MKENYQAICDAFCMTLRLTNNAGNPIGNPILELRYIDDGGRQYVRPIFADGEGEDGYYDVDVTMDSGTAMIQDITNQFIRKMW